MNAEFRTALFRGLFHATLVAAVSFFTLWTDVNISMRTLVSGTVLPALGVLGARFLGEGWMDTKKKELP